MTREGISWPLGGAAPLWISASQTGFDLDLAPRVCEIMALSFRVHYQACWRGRNLLVSPGSVLEVRGWAVGVLCGVGEEGSPRDGTECRLWRVQEDRISWPPLQRAWGPVTERGQREVDVEGGEALR